MAADETSETGSEVGDADNAADKDGLSRTATISSKLHIVTTKVTLVVLIVFSIL